MLNLSKSGNGFWEVRLATVWLWHRLRQSCTWFGVVTVALGRPSAATETPKSTDLGKVVMVAERSTNQGLVKAYKKINSAAKLLLRTTPSLVLHSVGTDLQHTGARFR